MLLPISGSGFPYCYYDWFVRARFWLAVSAIQSASILKPLKSFFYNLSHLWFFNYFMLWFFYNSLYILRNNDVIITLFFRIQWNSGWVPLEVIWKQFQWSVALRRRPRQKVARKRSEDRSFQKLKSRKILILDYDSLIWLINMTHPPLRLTQALWTSYACTF